MHMDMVPKQRDSKREERSSSDYGIIMVYIVLLRCIFDGKLDGSAVEQLFVHCKYVLLLLVNKELTGL